jgi:hypothetical protein
MKRIIVLILMVCLAMPMVAQKTKGIFEQLTEKYAEQDGFSASLLTNDMFELYVQKKNVDKNSEVAATLQSLESIVVISQSNTFANTERILGVYTPQTEKPGKENKTEFAREVHQEMLDFYKSSGYTLFRTEKKMGEDVKIYLKKDQKKITGLALITHSSVSTGLVELKGNDIDLTSVAALNKAINLSGLENLYKISNRSELYGRFPYSEYSHEISEEKMAEIEKRAREMAERHAQLSEEQIRKIEQQAQLQSQKQLEMAEKYRQLAEQYGRKPIFLNYPGDSTIYFLNGEKVKVDEIKKISNKEIQTIDVSKHNEQDEITIVKIITK